MIIYIYQTGYISKEPDIDIWVVFQLGNEILDLMEFVKMEILDEDLVRRWPFLMYMFTIYV